MDLEEKTLEQVGDRCEECGAKLTERELEQVLESGGPALCTVHAQEEVAVSDEDALEEDALGRRAASSTRWRRRSGRRAGRRCPRSADRPRAPR